MAINQNQRKSGEDRPLVGPLPLNSPMRKSRMALSGARAGTCFRPLKGTSPMPQPYTAIGLIPTVRGVRRREEIGRNLEHIAHLIAAASWLSGLDLPWASSPCPRVLSRASRTRCLTSIM